MNHGAILAEAIRCQQIGNVAQAEELCRQLVQAAPNNGEAWYQLGMIAWQARQYSQAHSSFEKCLAVVPHHAQAVRSLGGVLAQSGQFDAALNAFRHALRLHPDDLESLTNVGALLGQLGHLEETEATLRRVISLQPNNARAYYNLGVTLEKQGRDDEALVCYQQAAQRQPDNTQIYYNQGIIFKNQQRYDQAIAHFEKVVQLDPHHLDALATLGAIYGELEEFERARRCLGQVLQRQPDHTGALFNQAVILVQQNHTAKAITCYQQILQIKPDHLGAAINLGGLFLSQRDYAEAAELFQRAITIDAGSPEAHYSLWLALMEQGQYEAGLLNLQRAVSLQPLNTLWRLELDMFVPPIMPDEQSIAYTRKYLEAVSQNYPTASVQLEQYLAKFKLSNANPPLNLVYHGKNDRVLRERFAAVFETSVQPERNSPLFSRRSAGRYRLGFLVGKDHEIGFNYFVSGLINHLDPATCELNILCDASIVSTLQANLSHPHLKFVEFSGDIRETAARIKALGLDLIYFWEIGTDATNYFLPFFRLAPVQCTSCGTPDTTGIPWVNYFVSSRLFEPENGSAHYTEQLIRLQSLGLYYQRPQLETRLKDRTYFGFSDRENIYFCTQNLLKFHPQFDHLLAEILRRDAQGKILVKARDGYLNDALRRRWQTRIPDVAGRIAFVPRQAYADYLNLMQAADVLLDTIHYSGGTTSFEAIAVGTPIVTWPGEFMRGRMTYGCYQKIGVLDTIVWSAEEYVAKAVQLATDRAYQQHIRQKILSASDALFEDMAAVRELEQFFAWAIEKSREAAKNG